MSDRASGLGSIAYDFNPVAVAIHMAENGPTACKARPPKIILIGISRFRIELLTYIIIWDAGNIAKKGWFVHSALAVTKTPLVNFYANFQI